MGSKSVEAALTVGERALAAGSWSTARSAFESAVEHEEHPGALEGLSWTHWWQEDLAACLDARTRAYHAYRAAGDRRGAARMALWIGDDHLWYQGAPAVADGWFARARRLLEGHAECPEHGWLAVFDAHMALADGELSEARRLAAAAERIGRSQGVVSLQMFGVATEGAVLVEQGAVAQGLRHLDEASAAALAGEYEQLAPAAWSCCLLLSACDELRDDERGSQWCDEVARFSDRIDASFVRGTCRSHYGSILARQGRWDDAEHELEAAIHTLAGAPAPWRRDALARLGELRRRQGRREAARRAFEQAGEHWLAHAGLAALRLEDGDARGAAELAERALRRTAPRSPSRAEPLDVAVRSRLALGDVETASRYAEQLRRIAETAATRPLRATGRLCRARIAAASGDPETAGKGFADAVAQFEQARAPLEAAHARLELAQLLRGEGRSGLARNEARRAHAALTELGAAGLAARAAALLDDLDEPERSDRSGPLTPRQVEVLQLAAEGLTEQQIAARLVLSEHTVHRHLANIYHRLGCSSRAAAVAHASRIGVL